MWILMFLGIGLLVFIGHCTDVFVMGEFFFGFSLVSV